MQNTHTLTHKSGHLLAHSVLIALIAIAIGEGASCQAIALLSSAPKYNSGESRLSSSIHFSNSNHTSIQFTRTLNASSFSLHQISVGHTEYCQPPTFCKLLANQHLIGKAVRFDAAPIHFRSSLPSRGLGRASRGNTGRPTLASISDSENSDSSSDIGEQVAARFQYPNPQSVLSQFALNGAIVVSVRGQQAKVLSLDSQVLTAFEAQASSPFSTF